MPHLPPFRIGQGFDVHAFGEGDALVLGGARIPHTHGLLAHSDGDVLLHALIDALLGAAALGDIGQIFPDTDVAWKGADSCDLLRQVVLRVAEAGWQVGNVDTTVIAQSPRLAPFIQTMRETIAAVLGVALDQVSVKATTTERLGFTGRKEGIACQAVCLLYAAKNHSTI